jgi:signal transduction histidine kinase
LESEYYNLEENERIDFIKSIDKSSNQIYNLLENLLTWSRSQKGSIEFDPQTNDLNFIAQNTLELLSQSAKNKNIILFNRIPKDSFAYFDTNMITTVVRNLISNSIKYTPDGGTIKIESELKEDCICISIIDNGVGIAPERVNDLFKIDATQSTPGTNDEKGTGLGLILCKDFVMKHKGELVVKSALGIGTSFTFSIPIK